MTGFWVDGEFIVFRLPLTTFQTASGLFQSLLLFLLSVVVMS